MQEKIISTPTSVLISPRQAVNEMMRDVLEIVMLLSLVGGLFFVKHEFAKDKQERLKASQSRSPESGH